MKTQKHYTIGQMCRDDLSDQKQMSVFETLTLCNVEIREETVVPIALVDIITDALFEGVDAKEDCVIINRALLSASRKFAVRYFDSIGYDVLLVLKKEMKTDFIDISNIKEVCADDQPAKKIIIGEDCIRNGACFKVEADNVDPTVNHQM